MANVIMPKMGDAMEEGTLLRWLKQVGDDVAVGDPLAEIETDKVSLEIAAFPNEQQIIDAVHRVLYR